MHCYEFGRLRKERRVQRARSFLDHRSVKDAGGVSHFETGSFRREIVDRKSRGIFAGVKGVKAADRIRMNATKPGFVQQSGLRLENRVHSGPRRCGERSGNLHFGVNKCTWLLFELSAEVQRIQKAAGFLNHRAVKNASGLRYAVFTRFIWEIIGDKFLGAFDRFELVKAAQ